MTRRNLFALLLAPLAGLAGKAWPGRKASLVVLDACRGGYEVPPEAWRQVGELVRVSQDLLDECESDELREMVERWHVGARR